MKTTETNTVLEQKFIDFKIEERFEKLMGCFGYIKKVKEFIQSELNEMSPDERESNELMLEYIKDRYDA